MAPKDASSSASFNTVALNTFTNDAGYPPPSPAASSSPGARDVRYKERSASAEAMRAWGSTHGSIRNPCKFVFAAVQFARFVPKPSAAHLNPVRRFNSQGLYRYAAKPGMHSRYHRSMQSVQGSVQGYLAHKKQPPPRTLQ